MDPAVIRKTGDVEQVVCATVPSSCGLTLNFLDHILLPGTMQPGRTGTSSSPLSTSQILSHSRRTFDHHHAAIFVWPKSRHGSSKHNYVLNFIADCLDDVGILQYSSLATSGKPWKIREDKSSIK